jgi:hypothetical protein
VSYDCPRIYFAFINSLEPDKLWARFQEVRVAKPDNEDLERRGAKADGFFDPLGALFHRIAGSKIYREVSQVGEVL